MKPTNAILIEFNELCPPLLDRFISQGQLPNFKKFRDASTVYVTDSSADQPNLEPWIQWVTVHCGMPFAEHGVFRLGDGRKLQAKLLGQCLAEAGIPVGICSSMNASYGSLRGGYYLPDPWAKNEPHPQKLLPFYDVVAKQVQESSRPDEQMSVRHAASFLWFMLRNGLSLATIKSILKQLWNERRNAGVKWRRAALLDQLQYDVFRSLNKRYGVRFATFFSNSTAHYQHYFWRNMEPEVFDVPPAAGDHPSLQRAVLTGYQDMDALLGRFMSDYPDSLLILCTALSQQPWTETQKVTFRPKSFERFLAFAGLDGEAIEIEPVMAEQFHIVCRDADTAKRVHDKLADLSVDGRQLMFIRLEGSNVFAGCSVIDNSADGHQVRRGSDGTSAGFDELFYRIHTVRSGKHHPDGVLWIRNHAPRVVQEKVPLTAIAPTILAHFKVAPPASMREAPLSL
jgi:hypothetical protein